jgi:hypothetical protein
MNPAMTNVQTASIRPSVRTAPSALVEENRMKYPTIAQKVAGMKLKKKHMFQSPPKDSLTADSRDGINSQPASLQN